METAVVKKKDWLGQEAESVNEVLQRRHPGSKCSVHLMYTTDGVVESEGIEWFATRPPSFMTKRYFYQGKQWSKRWLNQILDWKPDLVHWQMNSYAYTFHLAARAFVKRGVPYVYQHHGPRLAKKSWVRSVLKFPNRMAERGIYLTRDHEQQYREGLGLDPAKNVVIPVGYDERFHKMDREECRQRTGFKGNPTLFWCAGINRRKDPLTVLKAYKKVIGEFPDAHFYIAGYGPMDDEVAAFVKKNKLENQVTLMGYVDNLEVPAMENAADIFVLGSWGEGFAVASMEAMACGCFPVLSTLPCFKEQTDNGRLGLLFDPGDVDTCAAHFRKVMGDVEYREGVRAQLPEAMSQLTWGHSAKRLVDLYEEVLAEVAARRARRKKAS